MRSHRRDALDAASEGAGVLLRKTFWPMTIYVVTGW
jgi:hypothetical protein